MVFGFEVFQTSEFFRSIIPCREWLGWSHLKVVFIGFQVTGGVVSTGRDTKIAVEMLVPIV